MWTRTSALWAAAGLLVACSGGNDQEGTGTWYEHKSPVSSENAAGAGEETGGVDGNGQAPIDDGAAASSDDTGGSGPQ
jgi:hypothetical protein